MKFKRNKGSKFKCQHLGSKSSRMKNNNTEVIFEKVMEVDSTEVRLKKGDKPKNDGSEIPN